MNEVRRARFQTGVGLSPTIDPRASEEARSFMQARLALLGLVTLGLSGGFLVVSTFYGLFVDGLDQTFSNLAAPGRTYNALGALVSMAVWLVARGKARSAQQLLLIDFCATVAAMIPYTLMSIRGEPGMEGVLMAALTVMQVLQLRSLMVPSDAGRTFWIGATGGVLSLLIALRVHLRGRAPATDESVADLMFYLALWLIVSIIVSTLSSWILFGLRQKVRDAERLGQYTLEKKLGEGGMGMVYRARHALLRRPTAIKLLPPEKAGLSSIARFEKEVQLTASLVHPNTITVFDYGHTPDGIFYYAMEYLDGADLQTVVDVGGAMPPARAVHVLTQVASGLAEAHEIGLIHRDIKPANIFLLKGKSTADLAKLLDFGLVREISQHEDAALTQDNMILGTPLYLAPEAISNPEKVDARSDLYALGAVAYFMLSGKHVFSGSNVLEICGHHLHTAPPALSDHRPVPEALEEIVMSLLSKNPDHRPQSAEVLISMLEACESVGAWHVDQARRWWADHEEPLGARAEGQEKHTGGLAEADTVAIDLGSRF